MYQDIFFTVNISKFLRTELPVLKKAKQMQMRDVFWNKLILQTKSKVSMTHCKLYCCNVDLLKKN